ncbi:MAG: DUF554 domain-containing protein [Ruminococcaceae bacterium]|nr:DUF554 domain-containing protein [Oscillospiraceae bacterium]
MGTLVNVAAVICGSLIGLLLKKGLSERLRESIMKALGVASMFIGIGCTMAEMLVMGEDGSLSTRGIMLMIVSLAAGTLVGELLKIEEHLEGIGERIKKVKMFSGSSRFTEGFVTATLVTSVGAMAIVGAMQDGLNGDPSVLFSKSILDFISTMIFASALGIGVLCSALPMGLYQAIITLFAGLLGSVFTDEMISNVSLVGSVLIFCVGINLFAGKRIKVGSMLPSLLVPIIYGLIMMAI